MSGLRPLRGPKSARVIGVLVLVALVAGGVAAFQRHRIEVTLATGDTIEAEFSREYKVVPYQSVVKIAGVKVGDVTAVETTGRHTSVVSMKLDDETLRKLGSEPLAAIRPALVLGGNYYVELTPGGAGGDFDPDHPIPMERTRVPVELDSVLDAVTPDARKAVRGTADHLDATVREARPEIQELLRTAPGALTPTGEVLEAARGTYPATDLTELVVGLQRTSSALTREDGQLAAIIDSLGTTASVLEQQSGAVADTVRSGPETLRTTRDGLAALDGSLQKLTSTATAFRPAALRLDPLLAELDPVLVRTRPVVADARALLQDARPLVDRLVPTARDASDVLGDVRGPVLDRVGGPLKEALLNPWHGTGIYAGGGNDHSFYQELGYLLSDSAEVFKFHDHNGALGRLMAGVGLSTAGGSGLQMSLEQYLESLGLQQPAGPQEGTSEGAPGLIPPPAAGNDAGGPGPVLPPLPLPLVSGGY
ncbi:MlaD family protein [Amycolatopsis thermoflava]|uniref:MlaD family protein n=1 Tax=Amycolatopsis thermoflava TaxID=84480 RepID=UPI003813D475